ncbi:MAG: velvet protein [Chaenotheca gracillima]|nr:MAG: velvet protein [Chaenotheca gracillima]
MASVMAARNETESTSTRITKEGRKLTYRLNVIQQPERARACGSGAKSSADRRPVDPPPVVELRIFEGDAMNEITFSHNANFVLFVTLETARPIAQGRVQQQAPSIPVLTGMPVSGMAYLDRPQPAGYFLFPDLSVRHEGKYRLSFNLYEEVKDAKDADAEPHLNHPDHPNNQGRVRSPMSPSAHVDWRLEVRSKPFTVFSAKKFPGLTESTALSRIVAEQGCRVRIRRDVRMRRRDNKTSGHDYDEFEDEGTYVRARATPTPDPYHGRSDGRDQANNGSDMSSMDAGHPYGVEQHPRSSTHDQSSYAQQHYASAYPTGTSITSQSAQNGYANMSSNGSSAPSSATSNGPSYQYPQYSHIYSQPPRMGYNGHATTPQYQNSMPPAAPAPPMNNRGSNDHSTISDYRQTSGNYPQGLVSQSGYTYSENGYGRPTSTFQGYMGAPPPPAVITPRSSAPPANGHALPPLQAPPPPSKMPLPLEPKFETLTSPTGPIQPRSSNNVPPYPSPGLEGAHQRNTSYNQYSQTVAPQPNRPIKRSYDTVFDSSRFEQPFRNGMRPSETDHTIEAGPIDYDDDGLADLTAEAMKMQYKRADGREISRRLPSAA